MVIHGFVLHLHVPEMADTGTTSPSSRIVWVIVLFVETYSYVFKSVLLLCYDLVKFAGVMRPRNNGWYTMEYRCASATSD